MEQFAIREATLNDLPSLLSMEQELIKAERPFDPTIREDPVTYYDLRNMLVSEEYYVLVAVSQNRIISSGYAVSKIARPYLDHDTYAYLGFMFTLPEYRGKGVNKLIIDQLKTWAKKQGLMEVRLSVYHDNLPAIRAYEKAGFIKHMIEMRIE